MKYLRIGVTETAMLLILRHESLMEEFPDWARGKLWHNWNSIGFYDSAMTVPVNDRQSLEVGSVITPEVKRYWKLYLESCNDADCLVHLRKSIEDADMMFGTGRDEIDAIFQELQAPPRKIEPTFRYRWVEEASDGRNLVIVSPFAKLMKQQIDAGNMKQLRPDFAPAHVSYYDFPYCFGNTGPHRSSFETLDIVSEQLAKVVTHDSVVLFSCGSMGVILADRMHAIGADVFYCGGSLQLFFGIMGERWRQVGTRDRALHPDDRLLDSYYERPELWMDPVPATFVPPQAKEIEQGCYW